MITLFISSQLIILIMPHVLLVYLRYFEFFSDDCSRIDSLPSNLVIIKRQIFNWTNEGIWKREMGFSLRNHLSWNLFCIPWLIWAIFLHFSYHNLTIFKYSAITWDVQLMYSSHNWKTPQLLFWQFYSRWIFCLSDSVIKALNFPLPLWYGSSLW